ncbi:MAG: hypothetical protein ACRC4N_03490, partial [Gammaproteobacteria bacterium]
MQTTTTYPTSTTTEHDIPPLFGEKTTPISSENQNYAFQPTTMTPPTMLSTVKTKQTLSTVIDFKTTPTSPASHHQVIPVIPTTNYTSVQAFKFTTTDQPRPPAFGNKTTPETTETLYQDIQQKHPAQPSTSSPGTNFVTDVILSKSQFTSMAPSVVSEDLSDRVFTDSQGFGESIIFATDPTFLLHPTEVQVQTATPSVSLLTTTDTSSGGVFSPEFNGENTPTATPVCDSQLCLHAFPVPIPSSFMLSESTSFPDWDILYTTMPSVPHFFSYPAHSFSSSISYWNVETVSSGDDGDMLSGSASGATPNNSTLPFQTLLDSTDSELPVLFNSDQISK